MSDADGSDPRWRRRDRPSAPAHRGSTGGATESVARLPDYEELKAEARSIKEDAIERLPEA